MEIEPDFWEGVVTSKTKTKSLPRLLIGLASWVAVFIFGVVLLVTLIWIAAMMVDDSPDTQPIRAWTLYGVMAIVIIGLAIKFSKKRQEELFFRYAVAPLKIGLGINILIVFAALVATGIYGASVISGNRTCQPLENQIYRIQQATIPIATDKSAGTAFAVRDDRTLLTAYHVIEDAKEVYANFASGKVGIEIINTAPELDLALLRIAEPQPDYLNLSGEYTVGSPVYVNGFPDNAFNAGYASLTGGIISRYISNSDIALNIDSDPPAGLTIIQTDSAINPGNSGGPMVGECGVVGVVSAVSDTKYLQYLGGASEQGISYAISSETAAGRFNLPIQK